MKKLIFLFIIMVLAFVFSGCGGSDSDNDYHDDHAEQGPMAGTWVGDYGGVTYTFNVTGRGPGYNASWDTSNGCFRSSNCSGQHISNDLAILCKDTMGNQNVIVYFQGTFDGIDTISGNLDADICGADLVKPFSVTRQ